jgi:hypothetical protein
VVEQSLGFIWRPVSIAKPVLVTMSRSLREVCGGVDRLSQIAS